MDSANLSETSLLLGVNDTPPVFEQNADGRSPFLFTSDHYGRLIPKPLGDLGLPDSELTRHIAWDIGIAEVTRRLAERLDAPAILSGYSRLVIDCNRHLDDPTSIAQESDGVKVPGNRGLDADARRLRAESCFWPYQRAIAGAIADAKDAGRTPVLISMHSFTPVMQGFERPWQIGILYNDDGRVAERLLRALRRDPLLTVGDNEPYSGRNGHGYGVRVHGEKAGLPHGLIELRQDLIDTHHGAEAWVGRLAPILAEIIADPELRHPPPAGLAR
jgi:predicted N-formylglutamate amidohydrolase